MKFFYRFTCSLLKLYFKLFTHHQVYGLQHIPEGAGIFAPNHTSYFDPPILAISTHEEVYFLARNSLFNYPLFGFMIKQLNAYPVRGYLKSIYTLLKMDKKVVIFPEGMRTYDGEISDIKSGISLISLKSECAIIPVYIHGTFRMWPRDQLFPKLTGKTACVFGSPIYAYEYNALDRSTAQKILNERLMDSLKHLQEWYIGGASGSPP